MFDCLTSTVLDRGCRFGCSVKDFLQDRRQDAYSKRLEFGKYQYGQSGHFLQLLHTWTGEFILLFLNCALLICVRAD